MDTDASILVEKRDTNPRGMLVPEGRESRESLVGWLRGDVLNCFLMKWPTRLPYW